MADNTKNASSTSANAQSDDLHVTFEPRSKSPTAPASKSSPILVEGEIEKFPPFPHGPRASQKSRSLTQAEINMSIITEDQVAALGESLLNDPPPMSLQEARERRASIKEERKRSIDFIRSRTNSRVAASARPSMEVVDKLQRKN